MHRILKTIPEGERAKTLSQLLAFKGFTAAAGEAPEAAIAYTLGHALKSLPEGERAAALKDILDSDWFTAAAGKAPAYAIQYTLQIALASLPIGERAAALKDILDSDWFTTAAGKEPKVAIQNSLNSALKSLPDSAARITAQKDILNSDWFIDAAGEKPEAAIQYTLQYTLFSLLEGKARVAALKDILNSDWFTTAAGKEPKVAIQYTLQIALKSLPEGAARTAALKDILDSDWFFAAAGKQPWEAIVYTLDDALASLPEGERAAALKDVLSCPAFIAAIKAKPDTFLKYGQELLNKTAKEYKAGIERELTRARNLHLRSAYNPLTWADRISVNINHLTINIFLERKQNKTIAAAPDKRSTTAPPPLEGFTLDNLTLHVAFNRESQTPVTVQSVNLRKIIDEMKSELQSSASAEENIDKTAIFGSLSEIMNYVGRTGDDISEDKALSPQVREQYLVVLDDAAMQIRRLMKESGVHTGNNLVDDFIRAGAAANNQDEKAKTLSAINKRLKTYGFPNALCMN